MAVLLSPAARIILPSDVVGDRWVVEHLLARKRYTLSRPAAAVLVAAARAQTAEELARGLAANRDHVRPVEYWRGLVETLRERALIVDAEDIEHDPELQWLISVRRDWSKAGWHEAAEYHTLSFDYPCVDYSEAIAILADRDRMRGYQAEEPDTDRFKLDYLDQPEIVLPRPSTDLASGTARTVWGESDEQPATVDFAALSRIISLSFGPTGTIVPKTDSAPLLRRSSPSGGGRNPSEGYLVVRDAPGIEPGWYHVTMRPFSLRRIEGLPVDEESMLRLFPNTARRFPFDIKALLVLTCVFERNMYRYREPRTFRTVHMDAGHIAGTLRIAARSERLAAGIYYCDAATEIERALGVDGLAEGYMLTIAFADGQPATQRQPLAGALR